MYRKSILIVEDMVLTAKTIEKAVISLGYRVTKRVKSYEDALKSIQEERPDIMLVDIGLKGEKDGIDLVETVHRTDAIPFIYLTSKDDDKTIEKIANTKPAAYLSKPFRIIELKNNLKIAAEKVKTQNRLQPLGNGYFYDDVTKNIFYHNKHIPLGINLKLFLEILIEGRGNIVPVNVIEAHIWGNEPPSAENALRNLLYRLRLELPYLNIETAPKCGYKLVIPSH